MKSLIITEKPSVARDIVAALGGFKTMAPGVWESSQFVCSHAVGHIFELYDPEDYDPKLKTWAWDTLPIVPKSFLLKPKATAAAIVQTLTGLCSRSDIDVIINACDAAREGELIFQELMRYSHCRKEVKRLWLQAMTPDAIRSSFEKLQPGEKFRGLAASAFCRSYSDWIIGMNATRAFSLKLAKPDHKGPWSAGRVQTPTLAILVHRELEILDFDSKPYFELMATFSDGQETYEGKWFRPDIKGPESGRLSDLDSIKTIQSQITEAKTGKFSDSKKRRMEKAPLLFNLTTLQKVMAAKHSWTAKRTLDVAQSCYESYKVLTYPRTESQYLPSSYKTVVPELLQKISDAGPEDLKKHAQKLLTTKLTNTEIIFDDTKISDHFAILPTGVFKARLPADEDLLFQTVLKRFCAAFFPAAEYDRRERLTEIAEQHFRTGPDDILVFAGWRAVYGKKDSPPSSDKLRQASATFISSEVQSKKTLPPHHHSEATLLGAMEHAGRDVDDASLAKILRDTEGLGTAATRADIIENLKSKAYVTPELRPTAKGMQLIQVLRAIPIEQMTSAKLTAELERDLSRVEEGSLTTTAFMQEVERYIRDVSFKVATTPIDELYEDEAPVAKCPKCASGQVIEHLWSYICNGCSLRILKTHGDIFLTRKNLATAIESGAWPQLMSSQGGGHTVGPCPIHKNKDCTIIETAKSYICEIRLKGIKEGLPNASGFYAPKLLCQLPLTREVIVDIIDTGRSSVLKGFVSKAGKTFDAALKLNQNGVGFDF